MTTYKKNTVWFGVLPVFPLLPALVLLFSLALLAATPQSAMAGSTSITVTKLAADGTTVLAKKTVSYQWLMDATNIPVTGDGTTHYYHQGPVFVDDPDEATEQALRWNPEENVNVEKDMGALKGTNVKDLCNLVGGMTNGDRLKIKASDGLSKWFAYKNVYLYSNREGPMVISWYKDGLYPDTGYTDGMRLVWFADTSTNSNGIHTFGNWDWHEAADSQYWYFYLSSGEKYPTTTGLSIQTVSELTIYSAQQTSAPPEPSGSSITTTNPATSTTSSTSSTSAAPVAPVAAFTADVTSGSVPLTVQFTDQSTHSPTSWAWDFDNDGKIDSTTQSPSYTYDTAGTYSVRLDVKNTAGSDDKIEENNVTVSSTSTAEQLLEQPKSVWAQLNRPIFVVLLTVAMIALGLGIFLRKVANRRK